MATQQGLFTQGPSVDDILQKRNQRQFDLQQQLMQQAAQGARDPAKMRAVSLFGSSLGRALGGAMEGSDTEVVKRQAEIDKQAEMQKEYSDMLTTGTPEQQLSTANSLMKLGYHQYGGQLFETAQERIKERKDQLALNIEKQDAEQLKMDTQDELDKKGLALADQLPEGHPSIKVLRGGNISQSDYNSAFDSMNSVWQAKAKAAVEQQTNKIKADAKQVLLNSQGKLLAGQLPKDHPLQEALNGELITTGLLGNARTALNSIYTKKIADGDVTAEQAAEHELLVNQSSSIAMILGSTEHPELYAQLVSNPTPETYKKAVTLLDKKPPTEAPTDIVRAYWGENENGETVRVGETREGSQVLMTPNGQLPVTGTITKSAGVTKEILTPAVVARNAYEYVHKSTEYKGIVLDVNLLNRSQGLFKEIRGGNARSVPLLFRTVSELFNGDSKAHSEIVELKNSGTITQAFFDTLVKRTAGGLTDESIDNLEAVTAVARKSFNTTLGKMVSQEFRSRTGTFKDPTVLKNQLLTFFDPSQIVDEADPAVHIEGLVFEGNGTNTGNTYMIVAGHIIQL